MPKTANSQCQPTRSIRKAATGGVTAAPSRPPLKNAPNAVERSTTGTQRVKATAMAGASAASSAPNRKRMTSIEAKPHAAPVSAVNADQARMAPATSPRAPNRSASAPHGACPSAYDRLKILNTSPI